jgi:hypothetical protein
MNSEKIDIYFTDYLANKTIVHSSLKNSMNRDNIDIDKIFTFSYSHQINKSYLIPSKNNTYFYSYVVPRIGDIIGNIRISHNEINYLAKDIVKNKTLKIKLIYSIGGILYNPDEISDFYLFVLSFMNLR